MAKPISDVRLMRFIAAALVTAVSAGAWDIWWHAAIGRDTFFEPPHLLLYSAVLAAIIAGAIGWYRTRDASWRRVAVALLVVPLSAPFDELWHLAFGVEDLSSPLVIWSPPHLALILSTLAALLMLLPHIAEDRAGRQFFRSLVFAAGAILISVLATPFLPIGPYRLLGPWGAILSTAAIIAPFIIAQSFIGGFGRVTSVAAFFSLLYVIQFHQGSAPGIIVPFHAHPPVWLAIAAILVPAAFLDVSRKLPEDVRGGAAGLLLGAILFGAISSFDPDFQFSDTAVLAAVAASAVGGVIGGFLAERVAPVVGRLG